MSPSLYTAISTWWKERAWKEMPCKENCDDFCHWENLFDSTTRKSLQDANYNAALASFIIGFWLNCTIIMSDVLSNDKAYQNLLSYTLAATARRAGPVLLVSLPTKCLLGCVGNYVPSCTLMAGIDTFFAVIEIESLSLVCFERLINAYSLYKHFKKPACLNQVLRSWTFFQAGFFSSFPIMEANLYGKDFDCANCTLNVLLPQNQAYQLLLIVIYALKNLKPIIVMAISLNFTRWIEITKISKKQHKNSINFSRSVCMLVIANIMFWIPIFLVRSSVIFTQLLYKSTKLVWSPDFVMWAICIHWVSPAFAMVGYICYDQRVKAKMLNLILLRPIDADEPPPRPE